MRVFFCVRVYKITEILLVYDREFFLNGMGPSSRGEESQKVKGMQLPLQRFGFLFIYQ